jgi:hypothetical protein
MARLAGTTSAAAIPCTARAAISRAMVGAAAQAREAAANRLTPIANTLRRPQRSPAEPPIRTSAPSSSR